VKIQTLRVVTPRKQTTTNNPLINEISQLVYELHCDEVQVFPEIFQQISPALNRCIYCLLERLLNKKNTFLNWKNHLVFSRRFSPLVDLGLLLIHEDFCGFQITHIDTPQSVGLLWTSDRLVAETSTWQQTTLTTDIHAPGGIRTHNLSRRAAVELRLRPRGHWHRLPK